MIATRWAFLLGVTSVVVPLSAQATRTLTATRDLKIDAAENDLTPVYALAMGRDGSIAVWQPQDARILFFDAKGTAAGSLGRKGEGPGEFRSLNGVHGSIGDTLWALDGARRLTIISPEHKYIRSTAVVGSVRAVLPDGRLIETMYVGANTPKPAWYPAGETRFPVMITKGDGTFLKLIGWSPPLSTPECSQTFYNSQGGVGGVLGIPYCAESVIAWADDGRFAVVNQKNVTTATGSFQLVVVATTGDTVLARSYSYSPTPVTKHVTDSLITMYAAMRPTGRGAMPPEAVAAYRAMKYPATFPPVTRMIVGQDGTVWLEVPTDAAGHLWKVLSAKGDPIGQVAIPGNVRLLAAARNAAWGVETDADDLQSVVRFRVGP